MEGFLCIDKPCGPTSFDVVAALRRTLRVSRIGHAGTLDPDASGLLLLALGTATRLLEFLPLEPKTYRFGVQFGSQTDTLDMQGNVVASGGTIPSSGDIEPALPKFTGTIMQAPPAFSAIKVGGVRAYRRAREGRPVALSPRLITIFSLHLLDYNEASGKAILETVCSGGTYVRALARDIAGSLGTYGFAFMIRRTAAGRFSVDTALSFENIRDAAGAIIPVHQALEGLSSVTISGERKRRIAAGLDIDVDGTPAQADGDTAPPVVVAYDEARRLIAVLRRKDGSGYHPEKVFEPCE